MRQEDVRVNTGGRDDFEQVVTARGQVWMRYAFLLCGDRHQAEDLLQHALLRCYRKWHAVREPDAYVRRAVTNAFLSWRRHAVLERAQAVSEPWEDDGSTTRAEKDELWAALRTLPRRQRAVLVLRYYEDLPDERIAELLGCAQGTVRSLASRALTHLRSPQLLGSYRGGGS